MELTKEEAVDFLKNIVNLESDFENLKLDLTFLNNIISSILETLPFQNITLMANEVKDRSRPDWPEVKEAMLKKHGGLCYPMNLFLYRLLEALGYSVTIAHSTVTSAPKLYTNDHIVVFVHDVVNKGDQFLAEVGFSCPTFQAVDMNFESESKVYKHPSGTFKYSKKGEKGIMFYLDTDKQTWHEMCVFNLTGTKEVKDCEPFYDEIFSNPDIGIFHTILRIVAYPNKRQVSITNNTLKTEDENGELSVVKLTNDDEHVEAFKKYFPQFSEDIVRQALDHWHQFQNAQTNPGK
ncbi:hypothetical protein LOTGIDRAFT_237353 [Lottia gigantea]|uniref:arylamine N-acetyltransferase n=1 Tax=Lottia gigantea TaxID=225164 RepID=V4BFB1_LOTGI|nr:hypothetical protein LOTGIDRAFT_237353 [Lottia gigantea]ESP04522.1 hypothetical protein LOTGIDRAFT_237353 [Lottia gigantea]